MAKPKRHYNDMGAPVQWDEVKIKELADDLLEWSKDDEALKLTQFFNDHDMPSSMNTYFCDISKYFAESSRIAIERIGTRRDIGAINKVYDSPTIARSARMYDKEYNDHVKINTYDDEFARATAKIDAILAKSKSKDISEDLRNFIKESIQTIEKK